MDLNNNAIYKFERKFTENDTYHIKITTEFLEELENCQNIDEILWDIKGNSGTFTIPSSKGKKSKIFDFNIGPIPRGERESFEVNTLRSNKRVESLGSLQVRLAIQATSKVYDMTKKKISEVEDESKKHCAKELKLDKFSNKQGLAYKVIKNKEARKSDGIINNKTNNIWPKNNFPPTLNEKPPVINKNEFTIRQKILHLLAVRPLTKEALLLRLQRFKVTYADRLEVDKCLSQLATLNKENMYVLSNQFIPEIREDWSFYTEEEKRKVAKLKLDSKTQISNRIPGPPVSKHSSKPYTPDSHENTRPKPPSAPHPSKTKIAALDSIAKGISYSDISRTLNVPENLLHSWKSQEHSIRQNFESGKRSSDFNLNNDIPNNRESTISPANSNSSFKTHISQDEGFVSGDKRSPLIKPFHPRNENLKRRSQHLDNSDSMDQSERKKLHLTTKNTQHTESHNDVQSSSSCEVTPKSDISQFSTSSLHSKTKVEKKIICGAKLNPKLIFDTQNLFNGAFEEYSKLCEKLKECESKIESLRSKCINGSENYSKIYKLAKTLLADMESPKFQALTSRFKQLELNMFEYLKILNNS